MRKLALLPAVLAVAAVAVAFRTVPGTQASPAGAWKLVEVTITNDEGTTTNQVDQPNLTIFTGGHYASVNVFGDEPRAELPEDPTDEQRLAAWQPFNANAGTYDMSGSDLTTTVIVAKSPNATANHRSNTSVVERDGDTLYRTFTNPNNGATFKLKYVRVE